MCVCVASQTATANTEIYINQPYYYPNGFQVAVSPASAATVKQVSPFQLEVVHASGASGRLQVQITAK